jgi:hypothetical protein
MQAAEESSRSDGLRLKGELDIGKLAGNAATPIIICLRCSNL